MGSLSWPVFIFVLLSALWSYVKSKRTIICVSSLGKGFVSVCGSADYRFMVLTGKYVRVHLKYHFMH